MEINNCPSCGGKVEFSPVDRALKCEKCSNVFPIEKKKQKEKRRLAEAYAENDKGYEQWKDSKRTFQCSNCGAQIILNKFEMSTKCSYCNTSSLVPVDKLPGLKPDGIIPFKISKAKAHETFKTKVKKRMFVPNNFKKNLPKTNIGATYISSFSYGMDCFATYDGIRAITRRVTRRVRTQNGYQTVTDTVTDYVPFSGSIDHVFDNIVVESSDKIEQPFIDSILPYYFNESYEYDDDYVMGYDVGYYDQSAIDGINTAKTIALSNLESMIRRKHSDVQSVNIYPKYSNEKFSYVLLPLYFINFKYKDKEYLNLMNGQTGKTSGKVPKSAVKVTFFTLFIILLVIGLPLLIILLTLM